MTVMDRAEVMDFFDAYRDAFDRLDGDAVADLWHVGSGITDSAPGADSARLTWWAEDASMRSNHRVLCDVYRRGGYGRAAFELLTHVPMGPNHGFAHVRWTISSSTGSLLQQFHTGYQLVRGPGGVRVLLAVAHQEDIAEMKRHAID